MQTFKIEEIEAEVKDTVNFRRTRPVRGTMRKSLRGETGGRRMWQKQHFEQMRNIETVGTNELYPTSSSFALVEEACILWGNKVR